MHNYIYRIYSFLFSSRFFYRFNKFIFNLGLRGIGILNYHSLRESGEDWFIRNFCHQNRSPVVLDIGGNEGSYAKHIKECAPNAEIFSFEPHPSIFKRLAETAKQYNFQALNLGCGQENRSITLYDRADQDGTCHASIYKDVIECIHKTKAQECTVQIVQLDDFIEAHKIDHIHLLKIDTEGYELSVLKGLRKALEQQKIDIIHFEFNEMNSVSRVFFKDFIQLLSDYNLYRLLRAGLISLERCDTVLCEIFAYQNIIAVRKAVNEQYAKFK